VRKAHFCENLTSVQTSAVLQRFAVGLTTRTTSVSLLNCDLIV
jgi:hypothetical protein